MMLDGAVVGRGERVTYEEDGEGGKGGGGG